MNSYVGTLEDIKPGEWFDIDIDSGSDSAARACCYHIDEEHGRVMFVWASEKGRTSHGAHPDTIVLRHPGCTGWNWSPPKVMEPAEVAARVRSWINSAPYSRPKYYSEAEFYADIGYLIDTAVIASSVRPNIPPYPGEAEF